MEIWLVNSPHGAPGICVHRTNFFDPEAQTRATVEPGQISNLLGRHPFGLSFFPVVPVQETEHYRAKPPAFAALHARETAVTLRAISRT
jgi:hypothetical protein